jgi:hypothetical protein
VIKWNSKSKLMKGEVITFVDDMRVDGSSKKHCHLVHCQFTSHSYAVPRCTGRTKDVSTAITRSSRDTDWSYLQGQEASDYKDCLLGKVV